MNWMNVSIQTDKENREKDDFYPTPPEATLKLLSVEKFEGAIWEPASGDGAISRILENNGYQVFSTDLVDRNHGLARVDFLMETKSQAPNIITNPPYKLADQFAEKAIHLATGKVAFLCRLAWLEGKKRKKLFESTPLAHVWVFSSRLKMQRGRQANATDASGAIAFAWFVWDKSFTGKPTIGWI